MSDEIEHIKSVKKKYEKSWLSLDNVVGIGVGLTRAKTPGILISVCKNDASIQATIPPQVEGIPVEIQYTGPIKAC